MSDASTPLVSFWSPLALARDLGVRPLERTLNGRRLVLFRDSQGTPRVLDARCPHRGANLAQGKVRGDCVECPLHGWRWDGQGACVGIPSQPAEASIPAEFRTRSHPVAQSGGVIWSSVVPSPRGEPPLLPQLADRGLRTFVVEAVVDIPIDWWVENILDVTHVPFAHAKTYGGQDPVVASYPVTPRADELGFAASTTTRHRYALWARLLHGFLGHFELQIQVEHWMPATTIFHVDMGKGRRQVLTFLASAESGTRTRVWIFVSRNYLRIPGTDSIGRRFVRQVIAEDEVVARRAVARVSALAPRLFSTAADAPSLEYLRLLALWQARERA